MTLETIMIRTEIIKKKDLRNGDILHIEMEIKE